MAEKITIARPYSRAVFALAREGGSLKRWSGALQLAAVAAAHERVQEVFDSPRLTPEAKAAALISLYPEAPEQDTQNFLRLLAENRRLQLLPEIAAGFEALRAEAENIVEVEITSVVPVADEEQARIAAQLRHRLGREVNLHNVIDESLIGGAVIRAGDMVIDGSVRGRLAKLAGALAR